MRVFFDTSALTKRSRTFSSLRIAVKPRQPTVKGLQWWTSPINLKFPGFAAPVVYPALS